MTVYLLWLRQMHGTYLCGAYDSREKAEHAKERYDPGEGYFNPVESIEVNEDMVPGYLHRRNDTADTPIIATTEGQR